MISKLRQARKAKGLSLKEVSQKLGVSIVSVHFYETSQNIPKEETWEKLKAILDIVGSYQDFFPGEKAPLTTNHGKCAIEGCERTQRSRHLCAKHYFLLYVCPKAIVRKERNKHDGKLVSKLRLAQKALKLTASEVGNLVGVSPVSILDYEYGLYAPVDYTWEKLKQVLHLQGTFKKYFPEITKLQVVNKGTCVFPGCTRPQRTRHMCNVHYYKTHYSK